MQARVCLAFPDVYDIGMSHLGFKILYTILNDDPRTLAERCYAPWVDMEARAPRARQAPARRSRARGRSATSTWSASRSSSSSPTRTCSTMLDLGGIPLRSADRGDDDPLVIAGGPTATHSEPLAPFFDAFVIGDGEEAATEIALAWTSARASGLSRAERLRALAKLGGVYVPSLYETARRSRTPGFEVVDAAEAPTASRSRRARLVDDLNRLPVSRTTARSAGPRRSSTA